MQRFFLRVIKHHVSVFLLAGSPSQSSLRDARFPLLSLRDIFPRSGGSLSSKGEPLAKPRTLHFEQKLCRHAKASPFGRGGCERSEQTERARMLTFLRCCNKKAACIAADSAKHKRENEIDRKPGSVLNDDLSRPAIADRLVPPSGHASSAVRPI